MARGRGPSGIMGTVSTDPMGRVGTSSSASPLKSEANCLTALPRSRGRAGQQLGGVSVSTAMGRRDVTNSA